MTVNGNDIAVSIFVLLFAAFLYLFCYCVIDLISLLHNSSQLGITYAVGTYVYHPFLLDGGKA